MYLSANWRSTHLVNSYFSYKRAKKAEIIVAKKIITSGVACQMAKESGFVAAESETGHCTLAVP